MTNTKPLLCSFETLLDETIQKAWGQVAMPAHLSALSEGAVALEQAAAQIGDNCMDALVTKMADTEEKEKFSCYFINFIWADRVKYFLILWRNIRFQHQKAQILFLEKKIPDTTIKTLKDKSLEVVTGAAAELRGLLDKELAATIKTKKGMQKCIEKWHQQQNPWPVFKDHITRLAEQSARLSEEYSKLESLIGKFEATKQLVRRETDLCKEELNSNRANAEKAIEYVEKNIAGNPQKVASWLEDMGEKICVRNRLHNFMELWERNMNALPDKMQVTVAAEDGLLYFKEINFKKNAHRWFESEIFPLFYEIWELTDNVTYGLKMALVNIRNRILMLINEKKEGAIPDAQQQNICQPVHSFLKKEILWEKNIENHEAKIWQRLNAHFNVSNIYNNNEEDFLTIPIEYTIHKFRLGNNKLLEKSKIWLARLAGKVAQIKTSVEQEEMLSISEKIVRYIEARSAHREHNQYAGIFLTKGFLGESFWVGRQREMDHFQNIIFQWKNGYRGAVLLSGTRYCGKSLFGEYIANRFFPNNTIRLIPNTVLDIQGRTMETGHDLGEVLAFVRKNTLDKRVLIWIDDLELWAGSEVPLHANVRRLKKHIDNYSGQLFYLVATSNWVKSHLDHIFEISKVFQSEIRLDYMTENEIRNAILIRHGATHKNLVGQNGGEFTPKEFDKIISKIYKSVEGNIGDALNQWAFSIRKAGDEKVVYQSPAGYVLPDFINPDNGILLAAIMMGKRANEYHLRKMFGPPFSVKYASILKRLLSTGLLLRRIDGWIEMNEVAANDTGRLLGRKKYLTFQ